MLKKTNEHRMGRFAMFSTAAIVGLAVLTGGCFHDNLLAELATSAISAAVGDFVFVGLDWILPTITP